MLRKEISKQRSSRRRGVELEPLIRPQLHMNLAPAILREVKECRVHLPHSLQPLLCRRTLGNLPSSIRGGVP